MSEMKHTPGPWSIETEDEYCGQIDAANGEIVGVFVEDPNEHDARLIAAAPELLDALKYATDALSGGLWDYGPGQDEHEKCNEVLESCRAVIAKATGGST